MLQLWALLACHDYALWGKPGEESGVPDGPPTVDTGDSGAGDTAAPEEACATFALAPAAPWAGAPTCAPFEVESWELAIESDDLHGNDPDVSIVASPVAVPIPGYGTRVLYQSDGGDVVGVDAATREEDLSWVDIGGDYNGLAAAVDQSSGPAWIGVATMPSEQVGKLAVVRSDDTATAAWSAEYGGYFSPAIADLDHDGLPEFVVDGATLARGANEISTFDVYPWAMYPTVADLDGDGESEILGSAGVWDPESQEIRAWTGLEAVDRRVFQGATLKMDGEVVVAGSDWNSIFVTDADGEVRWRRDYTVEFGGVANILAFGDVTGDEVPEICAAIDHLLGIYDLEGRVLWQADHGHSGAGGCSLADLDADGVYEVVQWGPTGLHVRDGRTGENLGSREDILTSMAMNAPVVADVDGDGSAEIVVSGGYATESFTQRRLFVVGPTSGRWARTRPVWNQWGYDVTSVRDDGTIVSFPFPAWATYNAFRAQPAHDGERPDLVLEATDACATTCNDAGTVRIAVQVSNAGSVEAPAGAVVRAYTWTALRGLREIASATIPEAIAPGMSAAAVELDVPVSEWGDRRVLEVVGSAGEECDWVNNREELDVPDPCAEAE